MTDREDAAIEALIADLAVPSEAIDRMFAELAQAKYDALEALGYGTTSTAQIVTADKRPRKRHRKQRRV